MSTSRQAIRARKRASKDRRYKQVSSETASKRLAAQVARERDMKARKGKKK